MDITMNDIKENIKRLSSKVSLKIDSIFIENKGNIEKYF